MSSSTSKIIGLFIIFVGLVSFSTFGLLKEFTGRNSSSGSSMSKEDVTGIIQDYIKENPKVIIDAVTQYQVKLQENAYKASMENAVKHRDSLENNGSDPFIGNKDGDVTVVEFFDYSCGYCKRVLPVISKLISEDNNVKVVFKEFPILGSNSFLAAKAALAVHKLHPEKYFDFHAKLLENRVSGTGTIEKIASELQLDAKAILEKSEDPAIQKMLEENRALAQSVGIGGTPAFTINGKFVSGAVDYEALKRSVEEARTQK